jgi:hypothetical protein
MTPDEIEYNGVRRQVINQILGIKQGLRRGLNHDLNHVRSDDQVDLVRYFLARDKQFQDLTNRAKYRRCPDTAALADDRRIAFENVIFDLCESGGLYFLNGMWSIKPSVTDEHRNVGNHRRRNGIGFNDASYHGRPRRDRSRPLQHVA